MTPGACLEALRIGRPLVHMITNFITANDCANVVLAVGGAATMAHDLREVEEITAISQALVCNMGAVGEADVMLRAAEKARSLGHPVILDPVAVGASSLRRQAAVGLLSGPGCTVIRGNASEIRALALGVSSGAGVEAADLRDVR